MMHTEGRSLETASVPMLCEKQKICLKKMQPRVEARMNAASKTELGNGKDCVWCQG